MIKLAVDLGTSVTKIYRADTNSGIVLAEPSCVSLVDGERVRAVGKEAKNLIGKTAEKTGILYPVYEGKIVNMPLAVTMLKEFFERIGMKGRSLRAAEVLFNVPCGISEGELERYVALAQECGVKKAWFVEQPYLAAIGSGAILTDAEPVFCLDIGGGVTNIAVLSGEGILCGLSMNVGGNNMDANILSRIEYSQKLRVGALTAERIKNEIGSLSPNALGTMVVQGSSTETYQPASAAVHASDLTECVGVYVHKIIEYAAMVLRNLSPEVSATVHRGGVYLSGGVMKMQGMPQYIGSKIDMRIRMSEEPQFATVLGGGALLQNRDLLRYFAKNTEN